MALKISGGVRLKPGTLGTAAAPTYRLTQAPSTELKSGEVSAQYIPFDRSKYLTVGVGDKTEKWRQGAAARAKAIKWGQFKLGLELLQFFNLYWDSTKVPKPVVVYVGSAIGTNIATVARMYPMFTWHLYDPRDHDPILKTFPQIHIHQQLFMDIDAKSYSGRDDIFFVSDIRSTTYKRETEFKKGMEEENERLVEADMKRQMDWVRIIKPVQSSLKFRLHYSHEFIKAKGPTQTYLDGLVYLQAWGPVTTTETRLVPFSDLHPRDWYYQAHEEAMFYHNMHTRVEVNFLNPLTNDRTPIAPSLGLLNDYDSILTTVTVMDYLIKFGVKPTKEAVINLLAKMIEDIGRGRTTLFGLRAGEKSMTLQEDDNE